MSTESIQLLDACSYTLKAPKIYQEIESSVVQASTMDSNPVSCEITRNASVWFDERDFLIRGEDGKIVRKLHHTCPDILDNESVPAELSGKTLKLGAPGDYHYYHWMVDALPKIGYLKLGGISLDGIDHFLVRELSHDFHRSTLEKLGIPIEKVIETRNAPKYQCEEILDVRMSNFVGMTMPRFVPEFLSKTFLSEQSLMSQNTVPSDPGRKLYVGRPRSLGRRSVANENELLLLLQSFGFEHLEMEKFSVEEQAELFCSATCIVTPHGGALTNLVYCRPGTQVVELFGNHVFSYFYGLANLCELDYSAVLLKASHYDRVVDAASGNAVTDQHITGPENSCPVDLDIVRKALQGHGLTATDTAA